MKTFFECC